MTSTSHPRESAPGQQPDFDAIVIGAGFGGLRMIYELSNIGMTVKGFEAGSDVGGTWYWNRYPGARTDTESFIYCYDFDKDLLQEWDFQERFPTQEQTLAYIRHVAERFDLRKHIQFDTRVESAVYDEDRHLWTVTTNAGETVTGRHFVAAGGLLSTVLEPPFPGVDKFEGQWYQTARWPHEGVDVAGKRVAVIGTGATAVQVIPTVAQEAEHLTVFQRTPNYVLPGRNYVIDDAKRQSIKRQYDKVWEDTYNHLFGIYEKVDAAPRDTRLFTDMPAPEQRRQVWEAAWEAGGFRFLFETFDDMFVNQECNDEAAEFVRSKIRAIVHDPETAEVLCPTDHPLAGKRPPLGHFYYETYNRPNVSLVGVTNNPIEEITATGIKLADGTEHEVDIIIFALGFDAITGSLTSMDVRGKGGKTIQEAWAVEAPEQYHALMGADFPNMFTMAGPQGPFSNYHAFLNPQAVYVRKLLEHMQAQGHTKVEVRPEAAAAWAEQCETIQNATVLPQGKAHSWLWGTNVAGKRSHVLFYLGGVNAYIAELQKHMDSEFAEFSFDSGLVPA